MPPPAEKVRGPEFSPKHGDHGHVGPVDHIPIKEPTAAKEPNAFHEQAIQKGAQEAAEKVSNAEHSLNPKPQ
jgi:hypothetical protein